MGITKRNKIVHEATFVETTLTQNWYENLISGQEINYSGGDIDDISFTPLTFQEVEENEQNSEQNFENEEENDGNEQNPETEMNDLPDLAPESEPEEESEEEYYESSDEEINRPERKNRTVHDYSKLNKYGTTVIGNIRPEETEIKKGRRNVKISIIGNTIKVEKKETEKEKKSHKTLIKGKYPKAYEIRIPKNRREMLKSEYKEEFLIAEKIELRTVQEHGTIKFVEEKKNAHKLKARLVALGYDQRKNEYHETFAPVARVTTIMILLVFGWINQMDIKLLDFKGAYLHAKRPNDTPVYLNEIPGIKTPPGKMNFLDKGLYGTLDAGNLWRQEVEKLLQNHGFEQAVNDPCLYIRKTKKGVTMIATWVDDLLIISNDKVSNKLKEYFEKDGFEISHFGDINESKYLGMNVKYDKVKKILEIDQAEMIEALLNKTNMAESKSMSTPMYDNKEMTKADQPMEKLKEVEINFQIDGDEKKL